MIFRWQGNTLDTSEMKAFGTDNPAMPFIYLTRDKRTVFVVVNDRMEGVEVHLATPSEIKSLAARHQIPELLNALKLPDDGTEPSAQGSRLHALIVEDDASSRYALTALLNRSGYQTLAAATISEAEAKLGRHPRCVILDLNLPDGQGTVLLQEIRAANLPIKVAVTTASNDPDVLDTVYRLKPDAVFRKPTDLAEVMHWLDAAA